MIIVGQDKTTGVNFDNITGWDVVNSLSTSYELCFYQFGSKFRLGIYKTKYKVCKVIDDIINSNIANQYVFSMPQDSEVV